MHGLRLAVYFPSLGSGLSRKWLVFWQLRRFLLGGSVGPRLSLRGRCPVGSFLAAPLVCEMAWYVILSLGRPRHGLVSLPGVRERGVILHWTGT